MGKNSRGNVSPATHVVTHQRYQSNEELLCSSRFYFSFCSFLATTRSERNRTLRISQEWEEFPILSWLNTKFVCKYSHIMYMIWFVVLTIKWETLQYYCYWDHKIELLCWYYFSGSFCSNSKFVRDLRTPVPVIVLAIFAFCSDLGFELQLGLANFGTRALLPAWFDKEV